MTFGRLGQNADGTWWPERPSATISHGSRFTLSSSINWSFFHALAETRTQNTIARAGSEDLSHIQFDDERDDERK
jgi:hypothetical protein